LAALAALVYLVFGRDLIALMTNLDTVRVAAARDLPWMIASPLVSFWCFQLDGIFLGATHSAEMRNSMVFAVATFLIATALFIPLWGNDGLWLALLLFLGARGVALGAYYPRLQRGIGGH
jgi:MATE family multidrug resistance protein